MLEKIPKMFPVLALIYGLIQVFGILLIFDYYDENVYVSENFLEHPLENKINQKIDLRRESVKYLKAKTNVNNKLAFRAEKNTLGIR